MTRMQRSLFTYTSLIFSLLLFVHHAHANVVGSDTQNFNPTTNGLDFVTVHSSETLEPGILNLGFFLNYAVNTLPDFNDQSTQRTVKMNDTLLFSDFNFGLGLMKNWDVGMSFPYLLRQTVDNTSNYRGEFGRTGLTEIRINTKYRFWGDQSHGFATILSSNINQIENNPFTGSGAGPTYNFELAYDQTFGRVAAAINLGYRLRNPGTQLANVPIAPFRNQYIASVAASYLLGNIDTKIIGELFGSYPAETVEFQSNRNQSSLEALAGVKHDITQSLSFHAGLGTEVIHASASPDWRVYTGINWALGPLFSKSESEQEPTFTYPPQSPTESFTVGDILFEFNSDQIRADSEPTLDRLAAHIKRPPAFRTMVIEGHTDSVGSEVYNLDLSQRRARNVRLYLIQRHRLDGKRIEAYGYGETRPIADNGNYQGRKKNRRVEFKIER